MELGLEMELDRENGRPPASLHKCPPGHHLPGLKCPFDSNPAQFSDFEAFEAVPKVKKPTLSSRISLTRQLFDLELKVSGTANKTTESVRRHNRPT